MEFRASWRSALGGVTLFMLAGAAGCLFFAVKSVNAFSIILMLIAALFAWLAWRIGRPLFSGAPVLDVDRDGIASALVKGPRLAWEDIEDVTSESVQGHINILITLVPGSPSMKSTRNLIGGKKNERRVALGGLPKDLRPEAVVCAMRAFAQYGGERAAAAAQTHEREAREEVEFVGRLAVLTPHTWALYLIVALNIGVWIATVVGGANAFRPAASDLFRWGANSAWAVTEEHQWWRLLTASFLHGGIVHLAFNMIGLWGAGKLLNRLHGNAQFLLIYFASALAGSALSLHFSALQSVGVGASGAVFGVIGALLVSVRKQHARIPPKLSRQILTSDGVFAAYSLLQGFTQPNIDNAAHVGGLVTGAVVAFVLAGKIESAAAGTRAMRAAVAMLAAGVAVAALERTTPAAPIDQRRGYEMERVVNSQWPKLQAAQAALQSDAQAAQAGRMSEAELLVAVESKHLPAMRAISGELSRLTLADRDPRAPALKDLQEAPQLIVKMLELQLQVSRGEVDAASGEARIADLKHRLEAAGARMKARTAAPQRR